MNDLISIALQEYGVKEIPGDKHNPRIIQYSCEAGFEGVVTDELAWCSIGWNWCAKKAGVERSHKMDARSWLKIGQELQEPEFGCTVIYWRKNIDSWMGHVGGFMAYSEDKRYIYTLGFNQKNSVCIRPYYSKKVLGFRRLAII